MRIGCLHAHYSNIEPIQQALGAYKAELVHFVEPGLDRRKQDADFTFETASKKVNEWTAWIADCHVDAILITCTYFTAVIGPISSVGGIPLVKIDDPLFTAACKSGKPLRLVFTNPSTVEGTLARLASYAEYAGLDLQVEDELLEGAFQLVMQGNKQAYNAVVAEALSRISAAYPDEEVIAAQLSMAAAAREVQLTTGRSILNPLDALSLHMEQMLHLERLA